MYSSWHLYWWLILSAGAGVRAVRDATSSGKALNVPASQFWWVCHVSEFTLADFQRDGDDGPWSTFRIAAGNASEQQFRVLPASDQSTTWLVLPEVCEHLSAEICEEARGGIFMRNTSASWKEYGQYELNTYLEREVGYDGDGLYGFDGLSLGWKGDAMPMLYNQSIAGIISPNFTLGGLALSPRPINFTDYNNPIPSLLQNLRSMQDPIPSLSWSYTAGAYNLQPKVFGSLVLGGLDTSRSKPNDVKFPFGPDNSRDFQVTIRNILVQSPVRRHLSTIIVSYISTLVPDIWLPTAICDEFSEIYGLTYDNRTQAFYINATQHSKNLETSPIVVFDIGPELSGPSVTITMPYWNFYLAATEADTNSVIHNGGYRFPMRRATSDTQYILGRAFLQSAYLTADYERNSFALAQALYPSPAAANIMTILPPDTTEPSDGNDENKQSPRRISTSAIIGITIGGATILMVIAAFTIFLYRRRQKGRECGYELEDTDVQHSFQHEMPDNEKKYEISAPLRHEMGAGDDGDYKIELNATEEQQKPAELSCTHAMIYELPAYTEKYFNAESDGHVESAREATLVSTTSLGNRQA